ncbi:hypothetical protein ACO1O0_000334 [Amphichorda felina]
MRPYVFAVSLAAVASAAQDKRQFSLPVEPIVTTVDGTTLTRDPMGTFTLPGTDGGEVPSPTSDDGGVTATNSVTIPDRTTPSIPNTTTSGAETPGTSGGTSAETSGGSSSGGGGVIITSTKTEDGGAEPTETDGGATTSEPTGAAAMPTPFAVGALAAVGLAMAL